MNRDTYIWGAGYYGNLTARDFEKKGLTVKAFIDTNATQIKTNLGLPVLEPCDVLSEHGDKPLVVIAVQNEHAIREIAKQLEDAGFKLYEDFEFSKFIEHNFDANGSEKYYNDERLYNTPSKTFAGYNSMNMELFGQYVNFIEIEIFSYCNRRCAFCPNSYIDRHSENIFMPPETYRKVIDELLQVNFSGSIWYSRYNEPLADKIILERLREAREKLPEATLNTFTNGDFVTKEYLDELAEAGMNTINIMRYPQVEKDFSADEQSKALADFANKLGLQYENISLSELRLFHPKLEITLLGRDLKLFVNNRAGSVDLFKEEQWAQYREAPCRSPFTNIYIGYDGSVTPCCAIRHDVPQHKDMVMGNVNEQSLYDIYAGHKFSQLRYQMRDHGLNKVFPCSICNDYHYPMPPVEETCQWNCKINTSKQYCAEILPQVKILHKQTFGDFRGAFDGKDVVICGAGPTLNYYEPIENAIHIAVNRALLFNNVMFDYFFVYDYRGIKHFMENIVAYKGNNCIKFIGNDRWNLIPEEYFNGIENIRKFFTDGNVRLWRPIPIRIDENPLWNSNTISIIALQFALFGRARKIYLAGCDTYSQLYRNTHFIYAETETPEHMNKFLNDTQKEMYCNTKIKNYHHIRDFKNLHYPDTKIITVNPIGLKGLFDEDIYTDSYLKSLETV